MGSSCSSEKPKSRSTDRHREPGNGGHKDKRSKSKSRGDNTQSGDDSDQGRRRSGKSRERGGKEERRRHHEDTEDEIAPRRHKRHVATEDSKVEGKRQHHHHHHHGERPSHSKHKSDAPVKNAGLSDADVERYTQSHHTEVKYAGLSETDIQRDTRTQPTKGSTVEKKSYDKGKQRRTDSDNTLAKASGSSKSKEAPAVQPSTATIAPSGSVVPPINVMDFLDDWKDFEDEAFSESLPTPRQSRPRSPERSISDIISELGVAGDSESVTIEVPKVSSEQYGKTSTGKDNTGPTHTSPLGSGSELLSRVRACTTYGDILAATLPNERVFTESIYSRKRTPGYMYLQSDWFGDYNSGIPDRDLSLVAAVAYYASAYMTFPRARDRSMNGNGVLKISYKDFDADESSGPVSLVMVRFALELADLELAICNALGKEVSIKHANPPGPTLGQIKLRDDTATPATVSPILNHYMWKPFHVSYFPTMYASVLNFELPPNPNPGPYGTGAPYTWQDFLDKYGTTLEKDLSENRDTYNNYTDVTKYVGYQYGELALRKIPQVYKFFDKILIGAITPHTTIRAFFAVVQNNLRKDELPKPGEWRRYAAFAVSLTNMEWMCQQTVRVMRLDPSQPSCPLLLSSPEHLRASMQEYFNKELWLEVKKQVWAGQYSRPPSPLHNRPIPRDRRHKKH